MDSHELLCGQANFIVHAELGEKLGAAVDRLAEYWMRAAMETRKGRPR